MGKSNLLHFLKNAGHTEFKSIQSESIKAFEKHDNLVLFSKTGSGKTLAFLFAILSKLADDSKDIQAIILVPSRELCLQIEEVFRSLKTGKKVTVCYGGHPISTERKSLDSGTDLVVGTPGRIADHIDRGNLNLTNCTFLVIDEFDKCLELGFDEDMNFISDQLTGVKYKMLVSATKMDSIPAYLGMTIFHTIDASVDDNEIDIIEHVVEYKGELVTALAQLLRSFNNERTIVFCNYREVSEDVSIKLEALGVTSVFYHGGLEQDERERALIKFRNGSSTVLVCTDLGSRGLDIPEINHVVHYQYPNSKEAFIHRKGRTARMSAKGNSYLFSGAETQLPEYVEMPDSKIKRNLTNEAPVRAEWATLYFSGGRKDKINKIDLVGFLSKKGQLKQNEIGLITVQDRASYVAVSAEKAQSVLKIIRQEKIKGKRLKIEISK